ncbi:VWA domain-containing protein [Halobacteriovorax sp. GB3]|uniref:vWA domain-containing protein n=1 Tax=Halobacteriovorax sp. GB3 TaxID=2719615 RepID=UPI00236283A3|nr:VWA domain-containing protein [Halobacteriovorax sp. GB3]MDD0854614.1 VWA domain-containing protein [Halobacteriovorax sp. GB3]
MNFEKISMLPAMLVVLILFSFLVLRYRSNFYNLTKRFFFRKSSKINNLSFIFFIISFLFLGGATLDLRGKPIKIESDIPDQKTIVLIDASASMLVEDVRPNRFQKALLMARHFVKNAAGHQISVVLFSDSQTKLIPFTDDIDLLDAKIGGLEDIDLSRGGSNISLAINESLQYFKEEESSTEISQGNLLIFTDSEEHEDAMQIQIPSTVNVAFVGVGTVKGGPIPIRARTGGFQKYKEFNGKRVISKLNESMLSSLEGKIENYKYWVVQSYNIPTEEVLSFFRQKFTSKLSKGSSIVKPVEIQKMLIPFFVFFIVSTILRQFKSLRHVAFIAFFLFSYQNNVKANEEKSAEEIQAEKMKQVEAIKNKIKDGDTRDKRFFELAGEYLKIDKPEEALKIYEERATDLNSMDANDAINYGTSLLLNKRTKDGLSLFRYIEKNDKLNDEQKEIVKKNIYSALKEIEQKKKQEQKQKEQEEKDKKDNKDKKDKNDKKDQGEDEKKDSKEDQKDSKGKGQSNSQSNKQKRPNENNDPKDDQQNKEKKKDKKKEEKKDQRDKGEEKRPEKSKPKSVDEKEEEIKKKRKMVKLPAKLKQVLNNDRNLQKRVLERIRNSQSQQRNRKDW